jgi:hypothetical protein
MPPWSFTTAPMALFRWRNAPTRSDGWRCGVLINGKSMAKFEKGHKLAKGGKRDGAGRKTNERKEAEKLVADIVREYTEKNLKPVLETYVGLAAGQVVEFKTKKGKKIKFRLDVDPATTRHYIDKFLPAAKQQLDVTGGITIVRVNAFDPNAK